MLKEGHTKLNCLPFHRDTPFWPLADNTRRASDEINSSFILILALAPWSSSYQRPTATALREEYGPVPRWPIFIGSRAEVSRLIQTDPMGRRAQRTQRPTNLLKRKLTAATNANIEAARLTQAIRRLAANTLSSRSTPCSTVARTAAACRRPASSLNASILCRAIRRSPKTRAGPISESRT